MAKSSLIPRQFHFRFSFACPYRGDMPGKGRHLVELPAACRIPFLGSMDGQREFADVRMAWNDAGLGLSWEIRAKSEPLYGEPERNTTCDGLSLWLDTRDTRTIHRASRYCQRFLFLAHNGQSPPLPEVAVKPIHRALEGAPAADLSQVRFLLFRLDEDGELVPASGSKGVSGYRGEVFLPAGVLSGFDPKTCSRLGFCYRVRDRELGDQLLAAGPEFPYWEDPSLWSVLELVESQPKSKAQKRAK